MLFCLKRRLSLELIGAHATHIISDHENPFTRILPGYVVSNAHRGHWTRDSWIPLGLTLLLAQLPGYDCPRMHITWSNNPFSSSTH